MACKRVIIRRVGPLFWLLGDFVHYADGTVIEPGDLIQIATIYRGQVIASMDTNKYLPGKEDWAYLKEGIMVDTDFGGLVHYTEEATDEFVLISRPSIP